MPQPLLQFKERQRLLGIEQLRCNRRPGTVGSFTTHTIARDTACAASTATSRNRNGNNQRHRSHKEIEMITRDSCSTQDVDRLLGLADQFLDDWAEDAVQGGKPDED
jgi:hypothetical protein